MRALAPLALFAAVLAPAAAAQPAPSTAPPPDARFSACVARIDANAAAAYEEAMAWAALGRELPAYRCAAMALVAQDRFDEAARRFLSLASSHAEAAPGLRAELFQQAGAAFMLARQPARARAAFTEAVNLVGGTPEVLPDLLIDRGGAYALEGDWRRAEEDFSRALDLGGPNALAFRLRSAARAQQGAYALAIADAEASVRLDPESIDARLTLGRAREAQRTNTPPSP